MKSIFKVSHLAALVIACVFLTASAQAQSFLTNGLVAYYPFNGNANDASGNGNDGVPQYLSYGNNRFGKTNGAALFGYTSGVSSYFYFGNNSQVSCPTLNTLPNYPITFTFWMNLTAYQTWLSFRGGGIMTIIGKEGSGYQDAAVSIYSDNGIATNQIGYLGLVWNASFSPQLKQWYHVCFSLTTNGTQTFYVNGDLVSQIVSPTILNCSTDIPFKIGDSSPYGSPNGYRVPFDGYLSDVRIYNRALSSNEVAQLYAIESDNSNTSSDTYVLAIKAATQIQQPSTTNLSGLITTPVPLKSTFTTATILSYLAQDEHAAGNYPSSTFPAGALLVVRGDSVIVTDSTTNELVDVSDILTAQSDDNSVFSGKQNNATGLAAPMLSEIQYQKLVYDDSAITNGAHLSFTLGGLATVVTKDTVNATAGTYSETVTSTVKSGAGTGNYQGTPFILSGSFTATCKKNASVP